MSETIGTGGRNLKFIREKMGLTQKEMAAVLNVRDVTYQTYETGRTDVKSDLAGRLSHFTGFPVSTLLETDMQTAYDNNIVFYTTISRRLIELYKITIGK